MIISANSTTTTLNKETKKQELMNLYVSWLEKDIYAYVFINNPNDSISKDIKQAIDALIEYAMKIEEHFAGKGLSIALASAPKDRETSRLPIMAAPWDAEFELLKEKIRKNISTNL